MTDKLTKPFTDEEKCDFIVKNNHAKGLRIEETDEALFALEGYEKLQDDVVVNLIDSEEYKSEIALKEKMQKLDELNSKIKLLDLKSLRALREGGIKDETTSQTWVEYYTQEIIAIRTQIANL